jgi:undecaprenyl diphosphate synthase
MINHIAFIMDGNRRWAKKKNFSIFSGHKAGSRNIYNIIEYGRENGIKILTFYALSIENLSRDQKEINFLLKLVNFYLSSEKALKYFNESKIKLNFIGEWRDYFSRSLIEKIEIFLNKLNKEHFDITINIAICYSAKIEICNTIKKCLSLNEEINEINISKNLYIQDVDLLIRTSGEKRISNFCLWQIAYSELIFSEKMWPDFNKEDFNLAILEYKNRNRRYGK